MHKVQNSKDSKSETQTHYMDQWMKPEDRYNVKEKRGLKLPS